MPPKKSNPGTAITPWDKQLAERAMQAAKVVSGVGGGGNFLSVKSGQLSYQGVAVKGNEMNVIVLAQKLENQHYAAAYDPNAPASPDCYAFGDDRKTMAPDPEHVEEPINETCTGCPMKDFGTAATGKGKACGDVMRLALIAEGDLEDLATAEVAYLKVPFYSTKEWAACLRQMVEVYEKSMEAFVTKISVVLDKKAQFLVKFDIVQPIEFDQESWAALVKKVDQANREIAFPYPKFDDAPAPAAPARRAVSPARRAPAAPPTPARRPAIPLPASTAPAPIRVGARKEVKKPKF
jgi:hypothetical protein